MLGFLGGLGVGLELANTYNSWAVACATFGAVGCLCGWCLVLDFGGWLRLTLFVLPLFSAGVLEGQVGGLPGVQGGLFLGGPGLWWGLRTPRCSTCGMTVSLAGPGGSLRWVDYCTGSWAR